MNAIRCPIIDSWSRPDIEHNLCLAHETSLKSWLYEWIVFDCEWIMDVVDGLCFCIALRNAESCNFTDMIVVKVSRGRVQSAVWGFDTFNYEINVSSRTQEDARTRYRSRLIMGENGIDAGLEANFVVLLPSLNLLATLRESTNLPSSSKITSHCWTWNSSPCCRFQYFRTESGW